MKGKRKTTKEFIKEAKLIYNNKYDYSLINYKNTKTKVKIICPIHGVFEQSPGEHLKYECQLCGIEKRSNANRLTNEETIKQFKKIHKDKYDYSLVDYKNTKTKVKIICSKHGEFEQTPASHKNGVGCPKCAGKFMNNDYFLEKSKHIHGEVYDYSNVNYIGWNKKVKIICKKHGLFLQQPTIHLKGCGCPKCSGTLKLTNLQFIRLANKVHENKYDYSKVNYVNNRIKVIIICPEHGEFYQSPNHHLRNRECPKCSLKNRIKLRKKTTEKFIEGSIKVHENKYDYSKVEYKNALTKVKIICKNHGIFEQKPNSHLNGDGCPICKLSKGEIKIIKILNKLNIRYETQKTFNGCKNKRLLQFDFFIEKYNMCIEYNGKQHYESNNFFGGKLGFINTQKRDKIKEDYCNEHGIDLLKIPYNKYNCIEEIILNNIKYEE